MTPPTHTSLQLLSYELHLIMKRDSFILNAALRAFSAPFGGLESGWLQSVTQLSRLNVCFSFFSRFFFFFFLENLPARWQMRNTNFVISCTHMHTFLHASWGFQVSCLHGCDFYSLHAPTPLIRRRCDVCRRDEYHSSSQFLASSALWSVFNTSILPSNF